jgi:uncharacterized protein YkwD
MNEFEATAEIGNCIRGLHGYTMTPEQAAARLEPAMADAVNSGLIHARITTAIRANHEALTQAQNRTSDLIKLRTLIASMGRASNPAELPRPALTDSAPGTTPTGHAAAMNTSEEYFSSRDDFIRYIVTEVNPARRQHGLSEIREDEARECFRIMHQLGLP